MEQSGASIQTIQLVSSAEQSKPEHPGVLRAETRKNNWHTITIERQNGTVEIVQPLNPPRPVKVKNPVNRHQEFESFQGSEDNFDHGGDQLTADNKPVLLERDISIGQDPLGNHVDMQRTEESMEQMQGEVSLQSASLMTTLDKEKKRLDEVSLYYERMRRNKHSQDAIRMKLRD